jgi:hypothetical protein
MEEVAALKVAELEAEGRYVVETEAPSLSVSKRTREQCSARRACAPGKKCVRIFKVCVWPEASCLHMCAEPDGISTHRVPWILNISCTIRAQVLVQPVQNSIIYLYKQVRGGSTVRCAINCPWPFLQLFKCPTLRMKHAYHVIRYWLKPILNFKKLQNLII